MQARRARAWLTLCVVLALGALMARAWPPRQLDWQPGLAAAQPWRWWTAALAHASAAHLVGSLAGLALVAALGRATHVRGIVALAWLAAWPLVHVSLLLRVDLLHFGGLSGVLHAGVAAIAIAVALGEREQMRWIGWAVLAGLALKVVLEEPWGPGPRLLPGDGLGVEALANATGAFWGAVCAGVALARDGRGREAAHATAGDARASFAGTEGESADASSDSMAAHAAADMASRADGPR